MTEEGCGMEFEDILLEDDRRIGRWSHMKPRLYDTLRQII